MRLYSSLLLWPDNDDDCVNDQLSGAQLCGCDFINEWDVRLD